MTSGSDVMPNLPPVDPGEMADRLQRRAQEILDLRAEVERLREALDTAGEQQRRGATISAAATIDAALGEINPRISFAPQPESGALDGQARPLVHQRGVPMTAGIFTKLAQLTCDYIEEAAVALLQMGITYVGEAVDIVTEQDS